VSVEERTYRLIEKGKGKKKANGKERNDERAN
jgi:hypothetical protein